jgi:hypothetical protein
MATAAKKNIPVSGSSPNGAQDWGKYAVAENHVKQHPTKETEFRDRRRIYAQHR